MHQNSFFSTITVRKNQVNRQLVRHLGIFHDNSSNSRRISCFSYQNENKNTFLYDALPLQFYVGQLKGLEKLSKRFEQKNILRHTQARNCISCGRENFKFDFFFRTSAEQIELHRNIKTFVKKCRHS